MSEVVKHCSSAMAEHLEREYNRLTVAKLEESVIRQVIPTNNFALMSFEKASDEDI